MSSTRRRSAREVEGWLRSGHPVVVVREGGAVRAFAACSEYRPRDCYRDIAEFSVYVAREARGRGLGGVALDALAPDESPGAIRYRYVTLVLDHARRLAELRIEGPPTAPAIPQPAHSLGADFYPLRLFREIDDALLRLRFNYPEIGLVLMKTAGDLDRTAAWDRELYERRGDWFVRETILMIKRTLKRMDLTAKSFFAIVEEGSCFAGFMLELALACDRIYMKAADGVAVATAPLNAGALPMSNGISRLATRVLAAPETAARLAAGGRFVTGAAEQAGVGPPPTGRLRSWDGAGSFSKHTPPAKKHADRSRVAGRVAS